MRAAPLSCIVASLLSGACAVPVRIVSPFAGAEVPMDALVDDLASADVVVFGEQHDTPQLHQAHHRILRALHRRRPDLIVSMEMFERDVQPVLLQYLLGVLDESEFLASARPWPGYDRDYRPIVEFARQHRLEVLAANAPRQITEDIARHGIGALQPSPFVARETTAADDDYREMFVAAMSGHPEVADAAAIERYYAAQCLKDDTMAETIVDRLRQARAEGRQPLVVHFCGHLHADHRLGTVARLLQREPELRLKTLGVESVTPDQVGTIAAEPTLADYVVLVPTDDASQVESPPAAAPPKSTPDAAHVAPAADPAADPGAATGRPGLGFRPDYEAELEGCAVADVVPGGAADAAGIVPGDVIVAFDGVEVDSVASYAAELSRCAVGNRIEVTVRRGAETLRLPVVVGRSHR